MTPTLVGKSLGQYRLDALVGRGGMAEVYRAYDPGLDRDVAVKVIAPHLAWDADFVERFLFEARVASRLDHHPNIVRVYHTGEIDGRLCIVMEYVKGGSVEKMIHDEGPMPPARVAHITRQVASALAHAHAHGMIHRDIKPSNILVTDGGTVKLTDFGLVRSLTGNRRTASGAIMGTPAYMSPEQAEGKEVSGATDVYGLGIVAYEMLTGHLPFQAENDVGMLMARLTKPPVPPRQHVPGMHPAVEASVLRALEKDIALRHADPTTFAASLSAAVDSRTHTPNTAVSTTPVATPLPGTTRTTPLPTPSPPHAGNGRRMQIIGPVVAGMAALAGVLIFSSIGSGVEEDWRNQNQTREAVNKGTSESLQTQVVQGTVEKATADVLYARATAEAIAAAQTAAAMDATETAAAGTGTAVAERGGKAAVAAAAGTGTVQAQRRVRSGGGEGASDTSGTFAISLVEPGGGRNLNGCRVIFEWRTNKDVVVVDGDVYRIHVCAEKVRGTGCTPTKAVKITTQLVEVWEPGKQSELNDLEDVNGDSGIYRWRVKSDGGLQSVVQSFVWSPGGEECNPDEGGSDKDPPAKPTKPSGSGSGP